MDHDQEISGLHTTRNDTAARWEYNDTNMHSLQFIAVTSSVWRLERVYMLVMCGSVTSVVISAVPCCSFVVENIRVSPLSRTFLLNCRNCGYTLHTAWIQERLWRRAVCFRKPSAERPTFSSRAVTRCHDTAIYLGIFTCI